MSLTKWVTGLLVLAGASQSVPALLAATINFEDPPYSAGSAIVGQDGWVQNTYVGPGKFLELNGDVTISNSSALAGSQSVLYNETAPLVGNGGGADISKANVITVVKDGTSAADLSASLLIQVDANSVRNGQVGVFLSFNGANGNSPIGVLLNNVSSATGSGRIEPLDLSGFNVGAAQPYVPNNIVELRFGVDFDSKEYDLCYRDVTAGGPVTAMAGSGVITPGRFRFNGGAFPDDGDGQSFTVDVGTLFRGGVGRIDDITLSAVPEPSSVVVALVILGIALCTRHFK